MSLSSEIAEKYWNSEFNKMGSGLEAHPIAFSLIDRGLPVETYTDGVGFMLTFANVAVFETDAGLVLIDCGATSHAPAIFEDLQSWKPHLPIHTCVYTHGHIDHCMGILYMEEEQRKKGLPEIRAVAHERVPARFDRYKKTLGYNGAINTRQFQTKTKWPSVYRYPDIIYRDSLVLEVGQKKKQTFFLFHDKGETDDSTWVWVPEKKVLCTGDLFIWATPNCGNPQKVQRYPVEWSIALKKMLALNAEFLFPGHGPPIVGKDRVRQALSDTIQFLDSVCDHTLNAINQGQSLNQIVHSLKVDPELLKKPYLRPVYDDPYFIVHNLWRQYCGWWDFNPAHLRPVKDSVLSAEICQLTGGIDKLHRRIKELLEKKDLNLAVQLMEFALKADPNNRASHELAVQVYKEKERSEPSTMAKGVYRGARLDSERALEKLKSSL